MKQLGERWGEHEETVKNPIDSLEPARRAEEK